LLISTAYRIGARADRKVTEELVNIFKRVTGEETWLFAIGKASLSSRRPLGQVVYPAVADGEQTPTSRSAMQPDQTPCGVSYHDQLGSMITFWDYRPPKRSPLSGVTLHPSSPRRMATVCHLESGRITTTFAGVAKHYSVTVAICPPGAGHRKGVVEKINHTAAQRWWRTLADELTVE